MPSKKKTGATLPESPFSRIETDPMRFLYGNEGAPKVPDSPEKPVEGPSESQGILSEVEELKKRLLEAEERAQKAEKQLQASEKRVAELKKQLAETSTTTTSQPFADPYGDDFEWLLTTGEGHSTLRATPIYNRVFLDINEKLKQHVGVTIASPQFIGLACCVVESLLMASDVEWKSDFKGLKDRVKTRNQTVLLRRLFDVMRRGIKGRTEPK